MTTYRLGDDSPPMVWEISTDLTQAIISATYTKANGDVVVSVCGTELISKLDRFGNSVPYTRITHEWASDDITVLGVGKIQLAWATLTESGSIPPTNGFRVEVVE